MVQSACELLLSLSDVPAPWALRESPAAVQGTGQGSEADAAVRGRTHRAHATHRRQISGVRRKQ